MFEAYEMSGDQFAEYLKKRRHERAASAEADAKYDDGKQHDDHVSPFRRSERVRLCNVWDLVLDSDDRGDTEYARENIRRLVRDLPEGRPLRPEDRYEVPEVYDFRLELCDELDLVPAERYRLNTFILEMATVEIKRRIVARQVRQAKRAKAKQRKTKVQKPPHILRKVGLAVSN